MRLSSDWQFLISTWSARDYAELRFTGHHDAFIRLADLAQKSADGTTLDETDWAFFEACEEADSLFGDIDISWWR